MKNFDHVDISVLDKIRQLQPPGKPSIVVKLIESYVENSSVMFADLKKCELESGALGIHKMAHAMRSGALCLGLTHLAQACQDLELTAQKNHKDEAVPTLISQLENAYNNALTDLKNLLEEERKAS